jgi:hypothetical protein
MPTYDDFRTVLKEINFRLVRSKKHETWQKILPDGTILQVKEVIINESFNFVKKVGHKS